MHASLAQLHMPTVADRTLNRVDYFLADPKALAEYGRVAKTLHMLAWVDDITYRRAVGARLNVGEGRRPLARRIFFDRRGELRQHYREGQEDQLSAPGLVVNMVTLWNTRYMDIAVRQLRASGHQVRDEDVARLSPLGFGHVNFDSHYSFSPPPPTLRALRGPGPADTDEVPLVARALPARARRCPT